MSITGIVLLQTRFVYPTLSHQSTEYRYSGIMKNIWSSSMLSSDAGTLSGDEDDDTENDMIIDSNNNYSKKFPLSKEQTELHQIDLSRREEIGLKLKENPWTKAASNYVTRESKDGLSSNMSQTAPGKDFQNAPLPTTKGSGKSRSVIQIYDLNPSWSFSEKTEPLKATSVASPIQKKTYAPISGVTSTTSDTRSYLSDHEGQGNARKKNKKKKNCESSTKKVIFGKIPRNVQPTSAFPIVQGLYNQGHAKRLSQPQAVRPPRKNKFDRTNFAITNNTNMAERDAQIQVVSDLSDDSIEESFSLHSSKRNYIDLTNLMSSSPPIGCSSPCSPAPVPVQNRRDVQIDKTILSNKKKISEDGGLVGHQTRDSRFLRKDKHDMCENYWNEESNQEMVAPRRSLTRSDAAATDRPKKKRSAFVPLQPSPSVGRIPRASPLRTLSSQPRSSLSVQLETSPTSSK